VIVIAMEDAPSTLYPPLAVSAYSYRAVELIHRGLFKIDNSLTPKPELVEKIEMEKRKKSKPEAGDEREKEQKEWEKERQKSGKEQEEEELILKLQLKKGVKTCYGNEITAGMVVFSIREYIKNHRFEYIKEIRELGKYELEIVAEPNSSVFYD